MSLASGLSNPTESPVSLASGLSSPPESPSSSPSGLSNKAKVAVGLVVPVVVLLCVALLMQYLYQRKKRRRSDQETSEHQRSPVPAIASPEPVELYGSSVMHELASDGRFNRQKGFVIEKG